MKLSLVCAVLLGLFLPPLSALELSVSGGLGNLRFDSGRDSSLGAAGEDFSPSLYFPLNAVLSGQYLDRISYTFEFRRGPILGNQLFAVMGLDFEYGGIALGPFFSLWNGGSDFIKPGLSISAGLKIPGKIFAEVKGNSTLGPLAAGGDHSEEYGSIRAGLWVPGVVVSISASREEFSEMRNSFIIQDSRVRYGFTASAFKKNVPYTADINFGYQILTRSYEGAGEDRLKSLYLGFEFRTELSPRLLFILGGEGSFYTWAKDPLKSPPRSTPLYEAYTGFRWTFQDP
jgi:hypothetical protein